MLLGDVTNIREVIAFPTLRPERSATGAATVSLSGTASGTVAEP